MQIKNIICLAILVSAMLIIAGCKTKPTISVVSNERYFNTKARLEESARSVEQSLQELAYIERAIHPAAKVPNPVNPDTIGMSQIISVDWTGPIEQLVSKIAKMSDYKVRVLGKTPPIPIIVSISKKETVLADILRDANFQCGDRANIGLYSASRVIELRYAKH